MVSGRGFRSVLGFACFATTLAIAIVNHGVNITAFTKEELMMHGVLLLAGVGLLSKGGFKDVVKYIDDTIRAIKGSTNK